MAGIEIDESRWPLVVVTWPSGPMTDAELDAFFERSKAHLRRGRFATLHDGVRAWGLTGTQRRRAAEYVAQHREELRARHVAAAIVSESAVVRGVVTAVTWLSPVPYPQRQFATAPEAEKWLLEMLR